MHEASFHFRQADDSDEDFILSLAGRFVDFALPEWRDRTESAAGVRSDFLRVLDEPPTNSWLYVAEDATGQRIGYLHLQKVRDFFHGRYNCHISDLATAHGADGRGVGRALLTYAEQWASEHGCALVTLSVFPGNQRALKLYRANGYDTDMLRLAKPVRQR